MRRSASSIQTSSRLVVATVIVLGADLMRFAQQRDEMAVVVAQLGEHVLGRHVVGIVVGNALQAGDMADRTQRHAADLAGTLGNRIGGREDLLALFVQQQMVVAEMRTGHMPVEILGLEVESEHIGKQRGSAAEISVMALVGRSDGVFRGASLVFWADVGDIRSLLVANGGFGKWRRRSPDAEPVPCGLHRGGYRRQRFFKVSTWRQAFFPVMHASRSED